MIQPRTRLNVADNTGAKIIQMIRKLGSAHHLPASIGDIVVASVKIAAPRGMVKKKEVVKAVIVRQTKSFSRADGTTLRFDDNAAVILSANGEPRGTRIIGPVARELRKKHKKLISMAKEVV